MCFRLGLVSFPVSTFVVNIVGCFLIGLLGGLSERAGWANPTACLFLMTGLCGGFTTFSAFANEIWTMGAKGELLTASVYAMASVAVGIVCVWLGRHIAV